MMGKAESQRQRFLDARALGRDLRAGRARCSICGEDMSMETVGMNTGRCATCEEALTALRAEAGVCPSQLAQPVGRFYWNKADEDPTPIARVRQTERGTAYELR